MVLAQRVGSIVDVVVIARLSPQGAIVHGLTVSCSSQRSCLLRGSLGLIFT